MRRQVREVVHDMRQPLAVITALVGAAECSQGVPSDVRRHLDQIKGQVRHLAELCDRMLDGSARHRVLAVDHVVRTAVREAELAHGAAIDVVTTEALVYGDDVNLHRAVGNLLDNACRASGPEGVRAAVIEDGGDVRITVSDAGPGFMEGPPGTASLGLGIVQAVVREHRGHVELGISDLGGAMVTLVMPRCRRPAAVAAGGAGGGRAAAIDVIEDTGTG